MNPGLYLPCLFIPFSEPVPSGARGLISCVTLTALRVARRAGRHLWACLWGCLWKRLALWLSKHYPPQRGWASANLLSVWIDQNGRGRKNLLSGLSIFFCPQTSVLLVLGPSDVDCSYTHSCPGPPAGRQQTVGLLGLHSHVSQSLLINLFLYLSVDRILFPWRTLTNPRGDSVQSTTLPPSFLWVPEGCPLKRSCKKKELWSSGSSTLSH